MSSFVPIYAVDFDGTLCESKWPGIGAPNKKLIQHLIQRRTEGAKVILWTCRVEEHLKERKVMRDGSYVIVDRLCEATTQLLEIIKKQEEIIEQCRISDELHKELDDMKNDVDQKMDLIEYDLRSYRREREE